MSVDWQSVQDKDSRYNEILMFGHRTHQVAVQGHSLCHPPVHTMIVYVGFPTQ